MMSRHLSWVCVAGVFCLTAASAAAQTISPAEQRIAAAQRSLAKNPGKADVHNELDLAFTRGERETVEPAYYRKAEEAIARSLELARGNVVAQKMRVWTLLGKHEFTSALESSRALNKQAPDGLLVYGFLCVAYV